MLLKVKRRPAGEDRPCGCQGTQLAGSPARHTVGASRRVALSALAGLGLPLAVGGTGGLITSAVAAQPATGPQRPPPAAPGTPAQKGQAVQWPEVTLLDGSRWGAAQAQGKSVIVVFWSTTCPFCLRHNAHLEKLRRAAAGKPLEILTVARERDPAAVKAYLARHGYAFQVTLDHAPLAAALSQRNVIPLSVQVDRQGRLQQVVPGEMFEEDVMEWLPPGNA